MELKRTRSQKNVLAFLEDQKIALSAQEIYIGLRNSDRSVGLATVYRALEALKLQGALQVHTRPNGEAAYALAQQDKHHLTCLQCGRSILLDGCPVRELETKLQRSHRFAIFYHTLEFFGLCDRCQFNRQNDTRFGRDAL